MILALCTTLGEHLVHKFIPPKLDDIKIIFKLYMSMFFLCFIPFLDTITIRVFVFNYLLIIVDMLLS